MTGSGADKKFVFVLGGARSGKSDFALRLSDDLSGRKVFFATAEPLDDEMRLRIERHRDSRGEKWETVEEPVDVVEGIRAVDGGGVVVLDCLTLWLTNLMGAGLGDEEILSRVKALSEACASSGASIVAVSNEVGLGVVPENRLARRFGDLSGTANRLMAEAADEVYFLTAGIPVKVK
ncbi:MAG TPA: bifunctional adenosylcobinamide kinase/adenosylcobinamide-phosphate guanylyltransferase [Thermodesulfobacteriota bacterium]|nr:bifunctional adenosylcobinamide kinase/adenosylcobinamide-phosphate guanylyltransferase [Thermodesulfobacteriota bacterium]